MRVLGLLLCLLLLGRIGMAQEPVVDPRTPEVLARQGFREYRIKSGSDWVTFYLHAPTNPPWRNLVLFLSGSTPDPSFSYELKDGKLVSYFWGHKDYELLPPDYAYAVIAKRGKEGALNESTPAPQAGTPAVYLEKNSLDYRVWQADQVINYSRKHLLKNPEKIIVYGHSEGAPVAAKLGTVNRYITHLGFWCGNALPDFFEFMLMRRKELYQGKSTEVETQKKIDELLTDYKTIFAAPNDTQPHNGSSIYTRKRWSSYAEAPVNHLVRLKIPLFVQVASQDENAPVETTYMIPLEFTRLGKINLTYKVGVGWDHSLNSIDSAGKKTSHWKEVFQDFISWTQK